MILLNQAPHASVLPILLRRGSWPVAGQQAAKSRLGRRSWRHFHPSRISSDSDDNTRGRDALTHVHGLPSTFSGVGQSECGLRMAKGVLLGRPDDYLRGRRPRPRRLPIASGKGAMGSREHGAGGRPTAQHQRRPGRCSSRRQQLAGPQRAAIRRKVECCTFADWRPLGEARRRHRHRYRDFAGRPHDPLPRLLRASASSSPSNGRRRRR